MGRGELLLKCGLAVLLAWAAVTAVASGSAMAAEAGTGELIASPEPGWPQWRGPRRDGVSDETSLLPAWPDGGPKRLWTASDLGRGYSSPIISGDTLYITGDVGEQLHISAYGLDGRRKWRVVNGRAWKKSYPGARASCSYSDGRLYHMNAHGRVVCLDAGTGGEIWAVNVLQRFEGKNLIWGLSEHLLADERAVYVTPGGRKGLMAALDKKTGKTLWVTDPLPEERTCYSSPLLVQLNGRRQLLTSGSRHTFAVDAETGKLLWTFRHVLPQLMVTTMPVFHGDSLFITNSSVKEGTFYRLRIDRRNDRVEKVWSVEFSNDHAGILYADGAIYGARRKNTKGCINVDAESGRVRYRMESLASGSAIHADGRLYCLTQRGVMALLKPNAESFETVGRFSLIDAKKKDAWAHPVICDGRLYLRYHDTLYCYDIRK